MDLFSYILLALGMSLSLFVTIRACAEHTPIRLTQGLAASLLVAVVHCLLMALGIGIGNMLVFGDLQVSVILFIGIMVIVALRMLYAAFSKRREALSFDISRWSTLAALAVASGINILIIGMATGFLCQLRYDAAKVLIPLLIAEFLFAYVGIMCGRQKVRIHPRRWYVVAVVFILVYTLRTALDKG